MIDLDEDQKASARKLLTKLPAYSEKFLKIKNKRGELVPLALNKAQLYTHQQAEDQLRRIGKVRKIIVKGRQQGLSTYIEARFYNKTTCNFGKSSFILSHHSDTTDKLFNIVDRFYSNMPGKLRPQTEISNRRRLKFKDIESEYGVGTAGADSIGRGGTVQYFHGSEVAYWPNAGNIRTGILQSIPDMPDTEIFLESTANGMKGIFYEMTMDALKGLGQYEVIFIPWFWQDEYRTQVQADFTLTDVEKVLVKNYQLTKEQLLWRRNKVVELGSEWLFKQEYPCNVMEAFQTSGVGLIDPEAIVAARQRKLEKNTSLPLIIGVDPGRNQDRTVLSFRRGRRLLRVLIYDPQAKDSGNRGENSRVTIIPVKKTQQWEMRLAGIVSSWIEKVNPHRVNIDIGHGWGVVDRLHEQGYNRIVRGVNFGEQADEPDVYANKRAEMWCRLRDWIEGKDGEVEIPDDDLIQVDLQIMPDEERTSNNRIKFPPKDEIRAEFNISTDIGDATALTFAFSENATHPQNKAIKKLNTERSGVRTLAKKRGQGKTDFSPGNIFAGR